MQSSIERSQRISLVLALLTAVGPVAMDMYLPVLPEMKADLKASTSTVQMTISACLMGMAIGQILIGRLSDKFGRKYPLLIGLLLFSISSILCALSSDVRQLLILRFIQGISSAFGIVIAQAIGRDLYSGNELSRFYGRLAAIMGAAAVIAPVLGGQLATHVSWRGFFVILSIFGLIVTALVLFYLPETLHETHKKANRENYFSDVLKVLAQDRNYRGTLIVTSFTSGIYFAYLASASFVLNDLYGLQAHAFSFSFAFNALGISLCGYASGRLSSKYPPVRLFGIGLGVIGIAVLVMDYSAMTGADVWLPIVSYFLIATGAGILNPPSNTIAFQNHAQFAATAASIMGLSRFAIGAAAAPLVSLGGTESLTSVAIVMSFCLSISIFIFSGIARKR